MADKLWKKDERKVMAYFGSTRKPASGRMSKKGSEDDGEHEHLHVQQKRRKKHSVLDWWRAAAEEAKKTKKIPLVSLTEHNRKGFWLVVHSDDLITVAMHAMEAQES